MQSVARTGKSHSLIGELVDKAGEEDRPVYISSTHTEAYASWQKFRQHGVEAGYLIGKRRAEEQGIIIEGDNVPGHLKALTPEAAKNLPENVNQYEIYRRSVANAKYAITVPELWDKIGDRNWLIATEEAAMMRMLSSTYKLIDIKREWPNNASFVSVLQKHENSAQKIIDYIDDLEQTEQKLHGPIRQCAQVVQDLINIIDNYNIGTWETVKNSFATLRKNLEDRLKRIAFEQEPDLYRIKNWLNEHFSRAGDFILNIMFYEDCIAYGDGTRNNKNDSDERIQLFMSGDQERPFVDVSSIENLWTAGNDMMKMRHFHKVVVGEVPDDDHQEKFLGKYTPVQESIEVIKYTGGQNPNIQKNHMFKLLSQVQGVTDQDISSLVVAGSSKKCAWYASRQQESVQPATGDTVQSVNKMAKDGMSVTIPENSRFSEGVDTPHFDMGVLYNGNFATPWEDLMDTKRPTPIFKKAEKIRAAQNSILRPSDVPGDKPGEVIGTGKTPVVVPHRNVEIEIFDLFEAFDVTVIEIDNLVDLRRHVVDTIEIEGYTVHNEQIMHEDEVQEIHPAKQLINEMSSQIKEND